MSGHIVMGTQLSAPSGFLNLDAEKTYHFLVRRDVVKLVYFEERAPVRIGKKQRIDHPPPNVVICKIAGSNFDEGLEHGYIVINPFQASLPSWCGDICDEGPSENSESSNSTNKKISHFDRIERTLKAYRPLLENIDEIINSENPIKEINKFARLCQPQLNGKRVQAEFFAYILYGQKRNVIAFQVHRIGIWDRLDHPGKKPGRKSIGIGRLSEAKSTQTAVQNDIRQAWAKWGIAGASIEDIYINTCAQIWKTKILESEGGVKYQVLADGTHALSYQQFRYQLYALFGDIEVWETLSGRAYVREEKAPSKGKFTEPISNAGERTEADGYRIKEVVKGPDGINPLPELVAVRIVCCLTGMFLGIGFSLGGENSSAYRMALFCMAVKKSQFGRLLGMNIDDAAWPSVGLCDDALTDRGPGSSEKAWGNTHEGRPVIQSMPPTGYGQGKAIIESSNPRGREVRDRPSHTETSFGLIDVIRREVQSSISLNDARDMSGRLTPEMAKSLGRITPLGIYNKLSERGRNCLRPIEYEQAIRAFLTPVELVAKSDGVYHLYQRYISDELYETGILQTVASSGSQVKLRGFMLDMSTRYCFLDWKGRLIELAAVLAIREDDEQLYISLHELEKVDGLIKKMKSDIAVHSDAVKAEGQQDLVDKTGHPPEKKVIKKGPPKRRNKKGNSQAKAVKSILSHAGNI